MLSILGLSPQGRIPKGVADYKGEDLLKMSPKKLRDIRGGDMAMIFQDPMTSLNPVLTVGNQIVEALLTHNDGMKDDQAGARAIELLEVVGVPSAERRIAQYPHEFSGGMRQRAMIAMAIANNPSVLIADEPTTALDVTIQAQIVEVLKAARQETHAAIVLITHDLGRDPRAGRSRGSSCTRVAWSSSKDVFTIFNEPRHPYTVGLMNSIARLDAEQEWLQPIPGPAAEHDRAAAGLRVPPPLHVFARAAPLPHGHPRAAPDRRQRSPRDTLPLRRGARRGAGRRRGGRAGGGEMSTTEEGAGEEGNAGWLQSPAPDDSPVMASDDALLRVEGLVKHFPIKAGVFKHTVGAVRAVDGVDISVERRDARHRRRVGLRQDDPRPDDHQADRTDVRLDRLRRPRHHEPSSGGTMRPVRREIQIVFQDPYASLTRG